MHPLSRFTRFISLTQSLLKALLVFSIILSSCETKVTKNESPRIRKNTRIVSPTINQKVTLHSPVTFSIALDADTLQVEQLVLLDGIDTLLTSDGAEAVWPSASKTGIPVLRLFALLSNGQTEIHTPRIIVTPGTTPQPYTYSLVNSYPHDPDAYTQGLEFFNGKLYESTGQRGESELRIVTHKTGLVEEKVPLDDRYFGEGLTIMDEKIYQLTWTSNICLVYDVKTLQQTGTFSYPTEGWGITNDGEFLIMSDGTENLYFRDPQTFEEVYKLQVYSNEGAVRNLNELEYINGKIFANIYQTETIAIIDPTTGALEGVIDLNGIFNKNNYNRRLDVLNGIAYNEETQSYFVTGKYWPKLFEIKINPKQIL